MWLKRQTMPQHVLLHTYGPLASEEFLEFYDAQVLPTAAGIRGGTLEDMLVRGSQAVTISQLMSMFENISATGVATMTSNVNAALSRLETVEKLMSTIVSLRITHRHLVATSTSFEARSRFAHHHLYLLCNYYRLD